jgi:fatty acid/phospholipid biosynthesis enzyme
MEKFVKKTLTDSLTKNLFRTICTIPALPAIKKFKKKTSYKEYGGALFLGVKKPVVKAHGSSDEKLFHYTIKQAEALWRGRTTLIATLPTHKWAKTKPLPLATDTFISTFLPGREPV